MMQSGLNWEMSQVSSWTPEEDARLLEAVEDVGVGDLETVALRVGGGRSRRACRLRYNRIMKSQNIEEVEVERVEVERAENVEEVAPDPVALLQARLLTEKLGLPPGLKIYGLSSGHASTQNSHYDGFEGILAGLQAMEDEPVGTEDGTSAVRLERLLGEMDLGSGVPDVLKEFPSDFSLYEEAVAAVSMQLAARAEDAEADAEYHVKHAIEEVFGQDADLDAPEVEAFLDEYVKHQLRQFKEPGERPSVPLTADGSDLSKRRVAQDVLLTDGRLVRVTIIIDKETGIQTLDEAYSDMAEIQQAMDKVGRRFGATARELIENTKPSDLCRLLSAGEIHISDMGLSSGPTERGVRENVERLYAFTGHSVYDTPYVTTPLQVYRDKQWVTLPHIHSEKTTLADPDDKIPFKNGISMLKQGGEIIINEFSVWMGSTWCDTAFVIDTSEEPWRVTDHVLFCYGLDINAGMPDTPEGKTMLGNKLDKYVDSLTKKIANSKREGASYVWKTVRPSPAIESLCKARNDSSNFPILMEMGRPVLHSARAPSTEIPERVARDVLSRKHVIEIR